MLARRGNTGRPFSEFSTTVEGEMATTFMITEEGKIFTINISVPDNYRSLSSALTFTNEEITDIATT